MPVLPFAHLALHRFRRLLLFHGFLEDPFCTVLRQSYILLPFLNGFYTPLYIYIHTSALHIYVISAYTSIITALHVFYRCLGYHIYIHVHTWPLLYFVVTPPPPPPHHPVIYMQYMHQIYMYILHDSHSL